LRGGDIRRWNLRRTLHSALGRTIAFLTRLQRRVGPTDVESAEDEEDAFEPLTAEQHAVIRRAEPKVRGRVIETLLPDDDTPEARPASECIDLERADTEKRKLCEKPVEDPDHALPDAGSAWQDSPEPLLERCGNEAGLGRESADPTQPPNAEPDEAAAALKAEAALRAEHLGNILIGGIALFSLVAFVIAMLAILFMK